MDTEQTALPPIKDYFTWNRAYQYILSVYSMRVAKTLTTGIFLSSAFFSLVFLGSTALVTTTGEFDYMLANGLRSFLQSFLAVCWAIQVYKIFAKTNESKLGHVLKAFFCIILMKIPAYIRIFSISELKEFWVLAVVLFIISVASLLFSRKFFNKRLREVEAKLFRLDGLEYEEFLKLLKLFNQIADKEREVKVHEVVPFFIQKEYHSYVTLETVNLNKKALNVVAKVSPIKDPYNLMNRLFLLKIKASLHNNSEEQEE